MSGVQSIDDLNPNPRNPRGIKKKASKGLRKSLEKYGDLSGITFNRKTGRLVCGHQRVRELQGLGGQYRDGAIWVGEKSYAVRIVDWDEKTEREANVAANNEEIQGDWSTEIGKFLTEIKMGMSAEEFGDLRFDSLAEKLKIDFGDNGIKEDNAPEPPRNPVTKLGDVWELGRHRVVCGDAVNHTPKAETLCSDPPYSSGARRDAQKMRSTSIGTRQLNSINRDNLSSRGYIALMGIILERAAPIHAYLFTDWRMWSWAFDSLEACGLPVKAMLVWDKQHMGMGAPWRCQHELIAYASSKAANMQGGKYGNVLDFPRSDCDDHPTEKPVALVSRLLEMSSGDIVDPFLGSGTTLIAAEQLGRVCYGIEIEPAYCDVVIERWENLTNGKAKKVSSA